MADAGPFGLDNVILQDRVTAPTAVIPEAAITPSGAVANESAVLTVNPTVAIADGATSTIGFEDLISGRETVQLPLNVQVPAGSLIPDGVEIRVMDSSESILGSVQLPVSGIPSAAQWDGSIQSNPNASNPKIASGGRFGLQVILLNGSTSLAESDVRWVAVLQIAIDVTSSDQIVSGSTRIHTITYAGPSMPSLAIECRILGISDSQEMNQGREVMMYVDYTLGNRKDHTLPSPVWVSLPPGTLQWNPSWGDVFCGGDLVVFCRAVVDGKTMEGRTAPNSHVIWGQNPPKSDVRDALLMSNFQVVGYRESRFTQFSTTDATAVIKNYQTGPLTVLRSFDNGFGIGQLTKGPTPTLNQLWNWRENVSNMISRLQSNRASAFKMWQDTQTSFPGVPHFTDDQLDLEMWARYNGGKPYHQYDVASNQWVRIPMSHARLEYADNLLTVRRNVDAGHPPDDW